MKSKKSIRTVSLAVLGGAALVSLSSTPAGASGLSGDSGDGPIQKKLISLSWSNPASAEEYAAKLKEFQASPFDGVTFFLVVKDGEGKPLHSLFVGSPTPWKAEWFQGEIDALKKMKSEQLKESFIGVTLANRDAPDAFDDEGWKNVVEHFRILSRVAKEAGLRGLLADLEVYSNCIVSYPAGKTDKSFDEYAAKVRQRGREVMEAMAKEYPDMVFFTLFIHSGTAMAAMGGDPRPTLESSGSRYSLMAAFVNGLLDKIPPTMTLVEGMEHSYPHATELAYLRRVNAARNTALALVAKENRVKYRAQVQAGLAIYMDAYLTDRKDPHSDVYLNPPLEGTLADGLRDATTNALEAVDEYVWVYDEQYHFWPSSIERVKPNTWDEMIPGANEALKTAKDPAYRVLNRARKEFLTFEKAAAIHGWTMPNLLKDGNFLPVDPKQAKTEPEPWLAKNSGGTLDRERFGSADLGSAHLTGTKDGSWTQTVAIKGGHPYQFRVKVREVGKGDAMVSLAWLDKGGKEIGTATEIEPTGVSHDGWVATEKTILAPLNASSLAVRLGAKDQGSDRDNVWYDTAELYEIQVN